MTVCTHLIIRRHHRFLVSPEQCPGVSALLVALSHKEGIVRTCLNTEAAEHATPDIEFDFIHQVLVPAVFRSLDVYDAMRTALGTGGATGAQVGSPDKLLAADPARCLKPLLRELCRNLFTKQVLEGQRHTLGYTLPEWDRFQFVPLLV